MTGPGRLSSGAASIRRRQQIGVEPDAGPDTLVALGNLSLRIMKHTIRLLSALAALGSVLAPPARALPEAEATAGRLVLRRLADAIVAVKVTVTLKVYVNGRPAPPNMTNVEVNGTVVTPEGVTVASLAAVDPKMIFEGMRAQTPMMVELEGSEYKDLRLRLADGTEIPAKILGRDPASDIVLIGPAAGPGGRSFTFVDLRQAPDAATVLGYCFHLSRLGEGMQRIAVVRPGEIIGIVERPSRRLVTSTDAYVDNVGCPVFDGQGRVLGISLRLLVDGLAKGVVVVPSIEVARQVAEQVGQATEPVGNQ